MSIRLVAFDLDGTLIRGSSCCELVAARIGHLERMREFERYTAKDEIAAARREMAGWYSNHTIDELSAGLTSAVEAPGLRGGFNSLRRAGVKIAIVSITWSFAVGWFARRLGAEFHVGTELCQDGSIVHVWPEDKASWFTALAAQLDVPREQTAAVGDSTGDLPMLLAAGHGYYLGPDMPIAAGVKHFPSGSIEEVARELLQTD